MVLPGGALCLPSVTRYGHKQLFLIQKTDALIHVPDNGKAKETISCSFQRSSYPITSLRPAFAVESPPVPALPDNRTIGDANSAPNVGALIR